MAIIPKTWQQTNLSSLEGGEAVNLEADVIAKYVERIMLYGQKDTGITIEKLIQMGYAK